MRAEAFHWTFHAVHAEEADGLASLATAVGVELSARGLTARVLAARDPRRGILLRAEFAGEEEGQEFWRELHARCGELALAMELVADPGESVLAWRPLDAEVPPEIEVAKMSVAEIEEPAPRPATEGVRSRSVAGLALFRPEIPDATLYALLRAEDPEFDGKLEDTIARIEGAGLPVINLLSYLDLPLFQEYAATHEEERDQNLFLHMLHTWTCYRRYGEVSARLPEDLAEALCTPRYLRVHTTQFRSPAPALCLQLPAWWMPLHGSGATAARQWVKEIYLTHCEPPTPAEDRELTLMIVAHDERGEFGFVPLELPLSLPSVEESVEAFFAPSLEDIELGANTRDLRQAAILAAVYCLYATAADRAPYLGAGARPPAG